MPVKAWPRATQGLETGSWPGLQVCGNTPCTGSGGRGARAKVVLPLTPVVSAQVRVWLCARRLTPVAAACHHHAAGCQRFCDAISGASALGQTGHLEYGRRVMQ